MRAKKIFLKRLERLIQKARGIYLLQMVCVGLI